MTDQWTDLARPPLNQRELRRALTQGPAPAWRRLDVVQVTGSTNADLAQRARDGEPAGLVLIAEAQDAGRGRRGRVWTAPPRSSITMSVLLRPAAPATRWAWLGMLAAVAIADALRDDCGLDARLKWPNDVLVPQYGPQYGPQHSSQYGPGDGAGRGPAADQAFAKVAGLLSEVVTTPDGPAVVLGMGINVRQEQHELPVPGATSLLLAGSARTSRDPVVRSVLRHLATRYAAWDAADGDPRAGLAAAYRERCDTIGRAVRVEVPTGGGEALRGITEGVDDEGRLMLRPTGEGPPGQPKGTIQALSVGDVVHIRPSERA